jgi:hypothetical protein
VFADWLEEDGEWEEAARERCRALAVQVGERYHATVKRLFVSRSGEVRYGRGGQERVDWHRYSEGYHSMWGPARCLCGGARLDDEDRPTCIILESYRRTKVARLTLDEARAFIDG